MADAAQRPTDREYDRYLWLVEEAKRASYDSGLLRQTGSFQVGDVLFTAIFACASDLLASLATRLRQPDDAAELKDYAAQARAAVFCHVDEASGLAVDVDLRTGKKLSTETIAGFAPLIAGGMPLTLRRRLTGLLMGPRWAGHPSFKYALPPSTSPHSAAYDPDCYWRGPVWPVFTWLLTWSLFRSGERAGGVVAAHRVARAAQRRGVRRVLPPGDRRAARVAAPVLDGGRRARLAARLRRGVTPPPAGGLIISVVALSA